MFCTPAKTIVAHKAHRCTNCGQLILKGDTYMKWNSVDTSWFTSKMHPECFDSVIDEDWFEYMPYSGERPKEIQ